MRLFLMSWETIGLKEKAVNSDLGLMEYALKGFRPKPFKASLASVPTALTNFQRAKVLRIFQFAIRNPKSTIFYSKAHFFSRS